MALLTRAQAADALKISTTQITRFLRDGTMKGKRLGNHVLIDDREIAKFMKALPIWEPRVRTSRAEAPPPVDVTRLRAPGPAYAAAFVPQAEPFGGTKANFSALVRAIYYLAKLEGASNGARFEAIPEHPCGVESIFWCGPDLNYTTNSDAGGGVFYDLRDLAAETEGAGSWQLREGVDLAAE